MTWWKKIAVDQLGYDPTLNGAWPKIIAETIGPACTGQPYRSWPDKIAGYLGLQPTNNAEELAEYIYTNNLFASALTERALLAGIGTLYALGSMASPASALVAGQGAELSEMTLLSAPDSAGIPSTTDNGIDGTPTTTLVSSGVTSGGTTTLHGKTLSGSSGKILYDIGTYPDPGGTYVLEYTPDFSALAQQGKLAMVGFCLKNGNDFFLVGLRGDGSTGVHGYEVYGAQSTSNGWNRTTGQSVVDAGAAASGTQAGPNYLKLVISADGTQFTLSSSTDNVTYNPLFTSVAVTPFSKVTSGTQFGPAVWINAVRRSHHTLSVIERTTTHEHTLLRRFRQLRGNSRPDQEVGVVRRQQHHLECYGGAFWRWCACHGDDRQSAA